MKTLTKTAATLLLALIVAFASSCKKKSDVESEITNMIVGTWTCSNHWYGGSDTYVFQPNGKYQLTSPYFSESGDYSFNGVILTTSSSTGVTRVFTILSLTDTYFVMMDQDADSYTYYKGGSSPGNGGGNTPGGGGNNGGGTGTYNGHEYVDLGLPSGTLWATCNIGTTTPEGYGDYFAWGETLTKTTYNWNTYKYCNGGYDQLTKYCNNSDYGYNGFTDHLTALQPDDDVAAAVWGSGWRMPTYDQWSELYQNTANIWTTRSGVNGRLFTASNGNTLFLPAAGNRSDNEFVHNGKYGLYWSSLLGTDSLPYAAWSFNFDSDDYYMRSLIRDYGFSVRPVRSAQ